MENYSVRIKEASKNLTARERLLMKDLSNATKLDSVVTLDSTLIIEPVDFCVLEVHNEKSDNKDYENFVIIDAGGNKYATGSLSFWTAFNEIWEEMKNEGEGFSVEVYKMESKNYKGKHFLTCSIV